MLIILYEAQEDFLVVSHPSIEQIQPYLVSAWWILCVPSVPALGPHVLECKRQNFAREGKEKLYLPNCLPRAGEV